MKSIGITFAGIVVYCILKYFTGIGGALGGVIVGGLLAIGAYVFAKSKRASKNDNAN